MTLIIRRATPTISKISFIVEVEVTIIMEIKEMKCNWSSRVIFGAEDRELCEIHGGIYSGLEGNVVIIKIKCMM